MSEESIGSAQAIIKSVSTTMDGGVIVKLELGAHDNELAKKLLDKKLANDMVYVAFVDTV